MKIISLEVVKLFLNEDEILVEYRDLIWFGKFKFYVMQGAGQSKYLKANITSSNGFKRTIGLHQLVMNPPNGMEVDHINNNGLDNRRSSLRIVTHQINQNNLPKRTQSTSKYHGVYYCKTRSSWQCQITFDGKTKTIGRYGTEIEAALAYNNNLIKLGLLDIKKVNVI